MKLLYIFTDYYFHFGAFRTFYNVHKERLFSAEGFLDHKQNQVNRLEQIKFRNGQKRENLNEDLHYLVANYCRSLNGPAHIHAIAAPANWRQVFEIE